MKKILNFAKYLFKILVVVVLLSFTETGKKVINNIVYNLHKTANYIFPEIYEIKDDYIVCAKYIIYFICVSYCLFFCLCIVIKYIYIILKKSRNTQKDYNITKLGKYIENDHVSYIFIDGPWGIGKTHYVLDELEKMNKEYYYISLFGLNSRELIIKELINEVKSKSLFKGVFDIPILGTIINIVYSINGLNILKTGNKKIIVFDDLERVAGVITKGKYEAKFAEYNDIIGFIEYFSQHFKEYTCIVIMNKKPMKKIFDLLIKPKLNPHIITLPFDERKVRQISKKYLSGKTETFIDIYTNIWIARRNINKNEQWTYRPMVKELEVLSKVNDEKIIIDIALSEFVDLFNLNNTTKNIGGSISSYFSIIIQNSTGQQLQIINDLVNYENMRVIIANANYQVIGNL
ncbi:hypothetical protein [Gemella sanguinis]|uniref:hypothetical protein n=1 Tax=Gemella sanguinis TaxID=84135 RepID=UPI0026EE4F1C|nr:hypothetical protein [Gemella sanguinis]